MSKALVGGFFLRVSPQKREKHNNRRAFSLVELLIVVLIIGIVYTLAIGSLESLKKNKIKPTLLNLKNHLTSFSFDKSAELICLDKCKNCSIYIDGKLNKELSSAFDSFFDSNVETYRYDFNLAIVNLKNKIHYNSKDIQEEICFSYAVDKNGVGDQVLVKYKNYVYDFTQYFGNTLRYSSFDDVVTAKEEQIYKVLR